MSCVAKLRDYYGLEKRPVKVCEPFQMLGLIEDDLREAIGIDVTPLMGRTNMFGFDNSGWRPWTFNGLEVLVPEGFRTTVEPEKGGTLIYPKGDLSAPPSGHMPKDGFFFDAIIRQKPIDRDHLNPEDNTEQYQPLTEAQLDGIEEDARRRQHRRVRRVRFVGEHQPGRHRVCARDLISQIPRACATSPSGTC